MATNALLLCLSLDIYPVRISVIVQHKISEIQHFFAAL